ncbi:hypothetical protein Bca4012_025830 [Brassica carinata]
MQFRPKLPSDSAAPKELELDFTNLCLCKPELAITNKILVSPWNIRHGLTFISTRSRQLQALFKLCSSSKHQVKLSGGKTLLLAMRLWSGEVYICGMSSQACPRQTWNM